MTLTDYQEAAWLALRHAADYLDIAERLLASSRREEASQTRKEAAALREQVSRLAATMEAGRGDGR